MLSRSGGLLLRFILYGLWSQLRLGLRKEYHGDENLWRKFNRNKPADWQNLQVEGARRGMAISHAGVGSHVTSTILMDPDHLLI